MDGCPHLSSPLNTETGTSDFNSIVEPSEAIDPLKISGNISIIKSVSPDVSVKSYYENNNHTVSPFSMEKSYGKGKIVFVEASGYFNAVSRFPEKYFSTLSDIHRLFGISTGKLSANGESKNIPFSNDYNIGNIAVFGDVVINSSSILLPMDEKREDDSKNRYHIQELSVTNYDQGDGNVNPIAIGANNTNNNPISSQNFGNKSVYHDVWVSNLEFYGEYKASIKSSGMVNLPSPSHPLSQYDYFGISIPAGLDLTVQLLDKGAHADITMADGTKAIVNSANRSGNKFNNNEVTEIYFHNIKPALFQMNSIDFLMKRPEVDARGNVSFESLFRDQYDFDVSKGIEENPLELTEANVDMNLGYVDNYDKSYENKLTTDYTTYLGALQINQLSGTSDTTKLRLPGDISDVAKQNGIQVPWEKAIGSNASIILLSALFAVSLIGIFLFWPRLRGRSTS